MLLPEEYIVCLVLDRSSDQDRLLGPTGWIVPFPLKLLLISPFEIHHYSWIRGSERLQLLLLMMPREHESEFNCLSRRTLSNIIAGPDSFHLSEIHVSGVQERRLILRRSSVFTRITVYIGNCNRMVKITCVWLD